MNKPELIENYTMEQLAEIVIKQEKENRKLYDEAKKCQKESEQHRKVYQSICHLENLESESARLKSEVQKYQNTSEVKNDEMQKLKSKISNLEEDNGRLQAKVDTYNNYLLPKATKEAKELIDQNHFTGVRIVTWEQWSNQNKEIQSENDRLQKEYAEALRRLEERQARIKELESKQYDGILFISVDGKPKAYTEEELCKMAKTYEDIKYCEEHSGEHLHSEEHLKILSLNRTVFELQSEVDKYRKAFEDAKKEHDCQIAEYRKKIEELENHHKFSMMQIDDVLVEFLGVTHEIMDKPSDFEKVLREVIDKSKTVSDFLPTEPIKVADMLINAEGEYEHNPIAKALCGEDKGTYRIFDIGELRQISEHLLVYCNHNGDVEE